MKFEEFIQIEIQNGIAITRKSKLSIVEKILESGLGRGILFGQAQKMALKISQGNYPAIPAIIEWSISKRLKRRSITKSKKRGRTE